MILRSIEVASKSTEMIQRSTEIGNKQRRIQRRRTGRAPSCLKIYKGLFLKFLTS